MWLRKVLKIPSLGMPLKMRLSNPNPNHIYKGIPWLVGLDAHVEFPENGQLHLQGYTILCGGGQLFYDYNSPRCVTQQERLLCL